MYNPFINSKLKKLYQNDKHRGEFLNLNEVKTILVLFDTVDYEEADLLVEQLLKAGKQVRVYAYKDKKDEYDYSETPYKIINSKEATDWFDNKIDEIVEKISSFRYDLLLDLTIKRNPVLEILALSAKARMKVGYKKGEQSPYDLSITNLNVDKSDNNLQVRELGKQIIHYLSTINKA
ncbi:hypothetical protein LJB98_02210 [Bacteroidales bacterium OttesenSCG-928-M11]|nr:hypothetical protein [Bacteroidales bacterium OttesenSCG-928-M11]